MLEIFLDVTERKKAVERYTLLSSLASEGVLIHENGVITDLNVALATMCGYTPNELIGQNGPDLLVAEDSKEIVQQSILTASDVPYQLWMKRKDGSRFRAEVHPKTIINGLNSHRIVLFRDLTEAHRLEEIKRDLIAIVTHEINQPLTIMKMALENCTDGFLGTMSEDQKGHLEIITHSLGRLSRLVNRMMDITKLEAGKMVLVPKAFDLSALMRTLIQQIAEVAQADQITVVANAGCTHAHMIDADSDKVEEVIMNLLNNACAYTTPGGRIEVDVRDHPESVEIRISDSGIGISKEDLSHLFSKFGRVGTKQQRVKGGSGLGLYISRQLVEMHGGTIGVDSEVGKGSTFYFTLPKKRKSLSK